METINKLDNQSEKKVPVKAHILSAWPLLLMLVGGAIGGVLGASAYSINIKIYKSNLSNVAKILLNLLTGLTAVILMIISVYLIRIFFV
ncbi:hypothetical protein F935_02996 [Acinetobacter calcoaceticus ANC 3811]|uniref:Uncharacterized protein n=1 Tax=Acinetobacter calcoaceticus ANC 3811 TaxID=1217690 RepID=R8XVY3_ACICA|nr:hypothetical protein [Acinetobacter calcoaceticus]EOQ61333.1 hypothetical protein F935_02996 [Acinetobacter calcoaceticus ANC 3811]